jgi:hypothetical protein
MTCLRQSSSPTGSACEMSYWGQMFPSSRASRTESHSSTSTGTCTPETCSYHTGDRCSPHLEHLVQIPTHPPQQEPAHTRNKFISYWGQMSLSSRASSTESQSSTSTGAGHRNESYLLAYLEIPVFYFFRDLCRKGKKNDAVPTPFSTPILLLTK